MGTSMSQPAYLGTISNYIIILGHTYYTGAKYLDKLIQEVVFLYQECRFLYLSKRITMVFSR